MAYLGKGEIPATHPLGNNQICFVKRLVPPSAGVPSEDSEPGAEADVVAVDPPLPSVHSSFRR